MLDMRRVKPRLAAAGRVALVPFVALLAACGGTMAFSDQSSLTIQGNPPAPPEPVAKPEPPKPKRVEVTADQIVIKEKIQFDFNKTTIKPESHGLLDEIVSVIKENPHIRKVSIEGHTDSEGSNEYNQKLSDGRAQAVLAYLTEHGIEPERLTAKGHGESKPLADNATEAGREQNRRVEFLILEQDQIKKVYEEDPETGERREVAVSEDAKDATSKLKLNKKSKEKAK